MKLIFEDKDIGGYLNLITKELESIKHILDQDQNLKKDILKQYQNLIKNDNPELYISDDNILNNEEKSKKYDEFSDFLLIIKKIKERNNLNENQPFKEYTKETVKKLGIACKELKNKMKKHGYEVI